MKNFQDTSYPAPSKGDWASANLGPCPTPCQLKRQLKLTELMRQLVAEHSNRRGQSPGDTIRERRTNSQPVTEVMQAVPHDDHPGDGGDGGGGGDPVGVTMAPMGVTAGVGMVQMMLLFLLLDVLEPFELLLVVFCHLFDAYRWNGRD